MPSSRGIFSTQVLKLSPISPALVGRLFTTRATQQRVIKPLRETVNVQSEHQESVTTLITEKI